MTGKLNRWGLASSRTRAGAFASVSYTEVPCGVSLSAYHCLLTDIYKTLGQSTIFPHFSGLKIEAPKGDLICKVIKLVS